MTENEFILQDRLTKIKSVVEQYGEDNFYISFSGGKDSTVLSALVDMAIPNNKIPRVFIDTGIEYNMIRKFVFDMTKHDERVIIVKPATPIKQMLESVGYPFKSKEHSNKVALYQKRKSIKGYPYLEKYLGVYKDDNWKQWASEFCCPSILKYQFTPDYNIKTSGKCCDELKKKPIKRWAKDNNKHCSMLGLIREEGGGRRKAQCIAFKGKEMHFQPLSIISKDWEEWFIKEYDVQICDIYNEPYNFYRTGCKGCPFALKLQRDLDVMEYFFPAERKQCEIIWKPVYDEYRRLGYRLKKIEPIKPEFEGQITFDDLLNDASCSTTEPVKEANHEVVN